MDEQTKLEAPFQIGEVFTKELILDPESIRKFAEFVGDPNPLHHDRALAQASRFGGLIASGVQSSSILSAFMASFVQARTQSLGLEIHYRFERAVRAGRRLNLRCVIEGITPRSKPGTYLLEMSALLTEEDGTVLVSGGGKSLLMAASPQMR
jgi:3-hydroxybutyryl-CoA dehydratase